MTLQEIKVQLGTLTLDEKFEVIRTLILDLAKLWPGIERKPDDANGVACIRALPYSVFPVWVLESYRRRGWSEARILEKFPGLSASELVNAWAYADAHPTEMSDASREEETVIVD